MIGLEPTTIIALGVAVGTIILSLGGAVRLSRARARENPVPRVPVPGNEGDMHGALMRRLHSDLNRTYSPRRPPP